MFLIGTNSEIDDFFAKQSADNAAIMVQLRKLMQQLLPEATEKIVYKLPFFYQNGRLCYFRPQDEAVQWSFCQGLKFPLGRKRMLYDSYEQAGKVAGHLFVPNRHCHMYDADSQILGEAWPDPMTYAEIHEFVYTAVDYNAVLQGKKKRATRAKP